MHKAVTEHCLEATAPKDRRPTWQWAHDNVTLFPPLTRTGLFDASESRHFIGPLDALDADGIPEVNVRAPVRSAKSLIGDVWLCSTVKRDPGPFRLVMQDDQVAKEHAEARTMPTLRALPGITFLLPDDRHKERGQEIIFPSGHHLYIHGPALGKLQSKGFRYMWVSEAWLPAISSKFGEIKGRLGDFQKMKIAKLFVEGQGGDDGDPWHLQFESGQVHEWEIQCAKCQQYMLPKFGGKRMDGSQWGIVWDTHKTDRGLWDVRRCVESVRFECEHCGHPHLDTQRTKGEWNRTGRYTGWDIGATGKHSFHWPFIIDYPWALALEQWLEARNAWHSARDITPTVVWFQKRMAVNRSPKSAMDGEQTFRREQYEVPSPDGESARFMTVDRQADDVFWIMVRSWTVTDGMAETRRIYWGKAYSFAEIELKRVELSVPKNRVLIDSGYRARGDSGVYAACCKYGWLATKGVGGISSFVHLAKRGTMTRKVQKCYAPLTHGDSETPLGICKLIRFSDQAMCDRVAGLIDAGKWIEPQAPESDPTEADYRAQMSSTQQIPRKNKWGATEMVWETVDKNNHAWDCAKGQALAAILSRVLPDPFSTIEEKHDGGVV